jgi:hypothetical protein
MAAKEPIKKAETALAVIPAETYSALAQETQELRELVDEFFADGLSADDLHLIRIPTGGGKTWELPGEEQHPTFLGVILAIQNTRAYWPEAFSGGGSPTACSSRDGITGVGNPGGVCQECPLAKWGSGRSGIGTACTPRKILYVLRPEDTLPVRLALPVTSFKPLREYQMLLFNRRRRPSTVATAFGLERTTNKSGIAYSKATFTLTGQLSPETADRAAAYASLLRSSLATVPTEDAATAAGNPALDEDDIPGFDWVEGKNA